MTLRELKAIVAQIEAPNLRLAGFCNDYKKMFEEYQIEVDIPRQRVYINNDAITFEDDLPVFGPSETKARILSVPAEYDHYELILMGCEEQDTCVCHVKRVLKTERLDDPQNDANAGLCLLGPVAHSPYRATIVFADTRMNAQARYADLDFSETSYCEAYITKEFETEEKRENFIKEHADYIDESVGDRIIRS